MKRHFTILLALLSTAFGIAQAPPVQWQVALGGTSYDVPSTIQQTADGGYIVSGYSNSSDGDLTGSVHYGTSAVHKIWVVKLHANGTIDWKRTYGVGDVDIQSINTSIRETSDGNYIVVGTAEIWGQFTSYLVLKLDSMGTVLWANNSIGGNAFDIATSVCETTDNHFVISGYSSGNIAVQGGYDYYIVKLDGLTGSVLWSKIIGGSGNDYNNAVQQAADGGFLIGGTTTSNNGDVLSGNHGGADGWFVKLDPTGTTIEWEQTIGGSGEDWIYSFDQTADGGYIIGGSTTSTNGDFTGSVNYNGGGDAFVMKLDSNRNVLWAKYFGGTGSDEVNEIKQTNDGGYIVAGVKTNTGSGMDSWTLKLDGSGNIEWQKTFTGSGTDENYSAQKTSDNGYILLLSTNSTDGDFIGTHDPVGGTGNNEFWVVKLSPEETQPQSECIEWNLANSTAVSSTTGNLNALPEIITGMTVYGYSGGEQLWTGGVWNPETAPNPLRYVEFNVAPAPGNDLHIGSISFDYNDMLNGMDFNIIGFEVRYSTDNWVNWTSLGTGTYLGTAVQNFSATLSAAVTNGSMFSMRIYPYGLSGSIAGAVSVATHSNVLICGTTVPSSSVYTGQVCGGKFNDLNGNGIWDSNESGIPNWQINLVSAPLDTGNIHTTTLTDENGNYCFNNVPAGLFYVSETQQQGWEQTVPLDPWEYYYIGLADGQLFPGLYFGNKYVGGNTEEACVVWDLLTDEQVTSTTGNITGQPEIVTGLTIWDYNNGQRLTKPFPGGGWGWTPGSANSGEYIEFNVSPASGNDLTVTQVSFDYNDNLTGIDFNLLHFDVYSSIDGNWGSSTYLGTGVYSGVSAQPFSANPGALVPDGSTLSVRIYPYSPNGSIPITPSFAVHSNVKICGETTPFLPAPEEVCLINYLTEVSCGGYTPDNVINDGCSMSIGPSPFLQVSHYDPVYGQVLTVNGWQQESFDATRYLAFNIKPAPGYDLTVNSISFDYTDLSPVGTDVIQGSVAYVMVSGSNWSAPVFLGNFSYSYSNVQTFSTTTPLNQFVPDGDILIVQIYLWSTQDEGAIPFFPTHRDVTICGTVEPSLGVEEQILPIINMYPNPVSDTVYFQSDTVIEKVEIIDITGKIVLNTVFYSTWGEIRMAELTSGLYFARVTSGNHTEVMKIIKR